jgi:hypothetical protein
LTYRGLNSNLGHFGGFKFIFVSCGESCVLVSWCAGVRCGMTGSDEDRDKRRRPGAEDRRWSTTCQILNGRTIGRSGDVMCGLYRARGDEKHEFIGLASKLRSTVCQCFCLKTIGSGFLVEPQNQGRRFVSGLVSKPLRRV